MRVAENCPTGKTPGFPSDGASPENCPRGRREGFRSTARRLSTVISVRKRPPGPVGVARAAHAAQRHHRLLRGADGAHVGELNEKQDEYLKDIYASGQHLLSLINDILDLSKIEAGRMELELTDFHLPQAIENALTLVRERAGRRSITLHTSIDDRLGRIQADERKVRQVVLNLLSNAIKFTPEGGRIVAGV